MSELRMAPVKQLRYRRQALSARSTTLRLGNCILAKMLTPRARSVGWRPSRHPTLMVKSDLNLIQV